MKTIKLNNVFFGIKTAESIIKFGLAVFMSMFILGETSVYNSIENFVIFLMIGLDIGVKFCGPFLALNLVGFILGMKGIKDNGFKGKKKLKACSILGIISAAIGGVSNFSFLCSSVFIMFSTMADMSGVLVIMSVCFILYYLILMALNIVMLVISIMNVSKLSRA